MIAWLKLESSNHSSNVVCDAFWLGSRWQPAGFEVETKNYLDLDRRQKALVHSMRDKQQAGRPLSFWLPEPACRCPSAAFNFGRAPHLQCREEATATHELHLVEVGLPYHWIPCNGFTSTCPNIAKIVSKSEKCYLSCWRARRFWEGNCRAIEGWVRLM